MNVLNEMNDKQNQLKPTTSRPRPSNWRSSPPAHPSGVKYGLIKG